MADFIDRQATINAVGLTTDAINFNPTKYFDAQGNELVAVVRCKDCKYYKGLAECDVIGDCMGTDGYCAWGERKKENE